MVEHLIKESKTLYRYVQKMDYCKKKAPLLEHSKNNINKRIKRNNRQLNYTNKS